MSELYPQLQLDGNNFRLSKCCEVLASLEREAVHYDKVRKKYNRTRNVFAQVGAGTGFSSVILSVGGLGTGLTGVRLPIVISLGALGGIFGLASIGCGLASKRLSSKVSKHEQTAALARAKTNTISGLVSKALVDNDISDKEFSLIIAEMDKFNDLKQEIRQKSQKEEEKKLDMNQLRADIKNEIMKKLTISTTNLA